MTAGTRTPSKSSANKPPSFPPSSSPRTWLITSTTTPIGIAIARQALQHGDNVVASVHDSDLLSGNTGKQDKHGRDVTEFLEFWREVNDNEGWRERCRGAGVDARCEGPFLLSKWCRQERTGTLERLDAEG